MSGKDPITILIVDDNQMTRTLLRTIIRSEERYLLVGEATNGEDAVEMALRIKPMLICLDHMMPKLSGIEVLQQIRPQLPHTAILMVTGNTERDTVQSAIQSGANGYIVKPFNAARVFDAMEKALAAVDPASQNTSNAPSAPSAPSAPDADD